MTNWPNDSMTAWPFKDQMTCQLLVDHTRSGQLEIVRDIDGFAVHLKDDGGRWLAVVAVNLEFERRLRMRTRLDVEQST